MPFLKMDATSLIVSMIWSTVGAGFWIYGKKQRTGPPLIGGVALIAASFLIESPLILSLVSVAIIMGIYFWSKRD